LGRNRRPDQVRGQSAQEEGVLNQTANEKSRAEHGPAAFPSISYQSSRLNDRRRFHASGATAGGAE
jgi:hypothetical protein